MSTPLIQPKIHALAAAKFFYPHVACNPVIDKICYQHRNDRPGVFGAYADATGYSLHPVKNSLLRFIDCDDPAFIDLLLAVIPRLGGSYRQNRGDHAAFGVICASYLPNAALKGNRHEIASLRGPGKYQVGAGSRHPSGDLYIGNGKLPITLTKIENNTLVSVFENFAGASNAFRKERVSSTLTNVEDWQMAQVWSYIHGYLDELRVLSNGRNDFINNRTAWNVGRLAHFIGNDERLIELIFEAAIACGYVTKDGERQARATIRSGFYAGKAAPRYPFTGKQSGGSHD